MDSKTFKKKYPNVDIRTCEDMPEGTNVTLATHNVQRLFDRLPEYQRTILNQEGIVILLGNRDCSYSHHRPTYIELKADRLSAFDDTATINNDYQRRMECVLLEETTHALFRNLDQTRQWSSAVKQDLEENNSTRELLLESHRVYSAIRGNTLTRKMELDGYHKDKGMQSVIAEIPAEIVRCRNFMEAVKKHANKRAFTHKIVQEAINGFYRVFMSPPEEEITAPIKISPDESSSFESYDDHLYKNFLPLPHTDINNLLTEAFPRSFPIFEEYENRLKSLAEDIKRDPASYPNLTTVKDYIKNILMQKPNKWDAHFSDFFTNGPAR